MRAATIETTALTHTHIHAYTHTHKPKNKKAQNDDLTSTTTAMKITTAMLTKQTDKIKRTLAIPEGKNPKKYIKRTCPLPAKVIFA